MPSLYVGKMGCAQRDKLCDGDRLFEQFSVSHVVNRILVCAYNHNRQLNCGKLMSEVGVVQGGAIGGVVLWRGVYKAVEQASHFALL
ncbi:hypothetical protein SAMN03159342_05661 [Pseudomonas sp. NFPP04]|nr:hypothetical protein SAMN03159342_05661 [Pseudomonas sp. NFPP04]SFK08301.1 hypothetical protein SAMN03159344_05663 [Pseudomonas sp. NFPP11]